MSRLTQVGDELRFDGEMVALLRDTSTDVRAFEDWLKHDADGVETDGKLFDEVLKTARGGLVRVADVVAIHDKLKGEDT